MLDGHMTLLRAFRLEGALSFFLSDTSGQQPSLSCGITGAVHFG